MRALGSSAAFRTLVAAVTTLAPVLSARASEPRAVDYLTKQSVAAATVRLADIAKTPLVQMYPVEVVAAAADDFFGISLDSIQRVTAVVEPPMGMMPQYAVVLNSSEAISFDRFRSELTRHTQPGELLGRPLLESQEDLAPSFCLLDDHTLAVGPKLFLKRYLRGVDGTDSELAAAMIGKGGEENQLQAAVLLQPLMPLIQVGLMGAKQKIEPEFHKYLDGIELLNRVVLSADLNSERESSLIVYANDGEAADRVESLITEGLALVSERMNADAEIDKLRNHEEAVVRAWAGYLDRMTEQQASSAETLREGEDAFVLGRLRAGEPQSQMAAVAVIGVLVALLLPAVQAAREAARRNASMNNLKQLALSLLNYESASGRLPGQAICAADGTPLLSWRVAVLPYLEEQGLYEQFRLDEPWDSAHNKPLLTKMPMVFIDPSSPKLSQEDGKTHYLGVAGPDQIFVPDAKGRQLRTISDGLSRTIMTVQVDDNHAVPWTKPADYHPEAHGENPVGGIGSLHPGTFLAGRGDGSVFSVPLDTDGEVLRAACTVAGGEEEADPR